MGSGYGLRILGRSTVFTGWRNGPGRGLLVGGILLAMPGLLFLQVLYYTLTTPFALIDDYATAKLLTRILDSREQFFRFLTDLTILEGYPRHRPFYEFYSAASWHVFGPVPWLHHLARWVMHFGAVFAFGAALLSFMPGRKDGAGAWGIGRLLPLATLAYLWIFSPTSRRRGWGHRRFIRFCFWACATG